MQKYNLAIRLPIGTQELNNCDIDTAMGVLQTKCWEYGVMTEVTEAIFYDLFRQRYRQVPIDILKAVSRVHITQARECY